MARIAIGQEEHEAVEVDLWGSEFRTKPATKKVLKALLPLESKVDDTDDPDELVGIFGEMLDVMLVSANGGRTKPSTLMKRKWDADELELPQLTGLVSNLAEAGSPN